MDIGIRTSERDVDALYMLVFVKNEYQLLCEVCSKPYPPRTQHRPICVTVNPVLVSRHTAFRRRFNLRKANWSGYATDVDILVDGVDPTPENYERVVEAIRVK